MKDGAIEIKVFAPRNAKQTKGLFRGGKPINERYLKLLEKYPYGDLGGVQEICRTPKNNVSRLKLFLRLL